ncbi:MAG: GNAT family N-acetyltransferase/peptidase C39 family protein [Ketobacteraceae bacterium]|nr:GNAT family N-acetyltransferase/peptidase C39 family protein [Ketobacteraceae bacterium]
MNQHDASEFRFRPARLDDLKALVAVEQTCFVQDRLSKRSLRRWIQSPHSIFLVIEADTGLAGYGLVWCHRGTRLARLYSLAVLPQMRGHGLAKKVLLELEKRSAKQGHLFMRLEVAKNNTSAIRLYESLGYRTFGEYSDYYDDHTDALRMQKTIRQVPEQQIHQRATPWYQQTTEFTCGPAALMMAMASLDPDVPLCQPLELDIWRDATTIFMTSGHGGCHPVGLALAARSHGFDARVYLNTRNTLFVDGVRSENKKQILGVVHQGFLEKAQEQDVEIVYEDISQAQVAAWLHQGYAVLILISTFRLDGKKAPHWVTVTGVDDQCFYVHDPDLDTAGVDTYAQRSIDCQHLPIAREDFDKMSAFGSGRLRTAVAIRKPLEEAVKKQ